MFDKKYISVRVCGNPNANAGFIKLISLNSPTFNIVDEEYGGFGDSSFFFTVSIDNAQTVYTLIKNNVRSNGDALRQGSLKIAISIPKQYELKGDFGPYEVLLKLKDEFLAKCMECRDVEKEAYDFKAGLVDQHALDETVRMFDLQPCGGLHIQMNPSAPKGYITIPPTKISQLFKNVQYPEFCNYSLIIVAEKASSVSNDCVQIHNLQIPKPVQYKLMVDGQFVRIINSKAESITVESKENSDCYENTRKVFSVSTILQGQNVDGVIVDEINEQINVSTMGWAKPKTASNHIKIIPSDAERFFRSHKDLLRVTKNGLAVSLDSNFGFTLRGSEIAGKIEIAVNANTHYELETYAGFPGNEWRVTVKKKDEQVVGGDSDVRVIEPMRNVNVVDVKLVLNAAYVSQKSSEILSVSYKAEVGNDILTSNVLFKVIPSDRKNMEGHLYVPKELIQRGSYFSFIAKPYRFDSIHGIDSRNNEYTIKQIDFDKTKLPKISRTMIQILIVSIIALLIGLVGGYFGRPLIENNKKDALIDSVDTGVVAETPTEEVPTDDSEERAKEFLNQAKNTLNNEHLTFEDIHSLHNRYETFSYYEKFAEVDADGVACRIEAYESLAKAIEEKDVDKAKRICDEGKIFDCHKGKVQLLSRANCNGIKSFEAIKEPVKADDEYVTCDYPTCGKRVKKSQLREHKLKYHPYICPNCSTKFATQEELNQHIQDVHNE